MEYFVIVFGFNDFISWSVRLLNQVQTYHREHQISISKIDHQYPDLGWNGRPSRCHFCGLSRWSDEGGCKSFKEVSSAGYPEYEVTQLILLKAW